jgi:hypothetical protein
MRSPRKRRGLAGGGHLADGAQQVEEIAVQIADNGDRQRNAHNGRLAAENVLADPQERKHQVEGKNRHDEGRRARAGAQELALHCKIEVKVAQGPEIRVDRSSATASIL